MVSDKDKVTKRRMHSMPELPPERQRSLKLYIYSDSQDGPTLTYEGERQGGAVRGHCVRSATELDASALQWIQRELESRTSTELLHRHTPTGHVFLEPL